MSVNLEHVEIPVAGMYCNRCPQTIEKALKGIAGVKKVSVNFSTKNAHVEFDPEAASLKKIVDRLA